MTPCRNAKLVRTLRAGKLMSHVFSSEHALIYIYKSNHIDIYFIRCIYKSETFQSTNGKFAFIEQVFC